MKAAFVIPGNIDLPTGGYAYDRRVLALLPRHGVEAQHVALGDGYPFPTATELRESAGRLRSFGADCVLLIDGLAFGTFPEAMVRGIEAPIVALCHHPLAFEAGLTVEQQRAFLAREAAALALARHVIVTSPATKMLLARDLAVPETHITVALPGTDRARRAEGSGGGLQMLAVGSLIPRKGYDVLLEALSHLPARLPWHLTIAGADDRSPATTSRLRGMIAASGWDDRVRLLGPVDSARLDRLYHEADLFVMPSLFEGYGMVLAEAMARGLPIVCTTGGAAAGTVPDDAALKVPPGDASALAAALERALGDRSLREERLASASWRAALDLPTWEETAATVARVLKEARA